jgi:hypothetical protein
VSAWDTRLVNKTAVAIPAIVFQAVFYCVNVPFLGHGPLNFEGNLIKNAIGAHCNNFGMFNGSPIHGKKLYKQLLL